MNRIAPQRCLLCGIPPRRSFRLSNRAWLHHCPRCRMAWWDWPPFEPTKLYDRDYFQSPDARQGYDRYASLEPGLRRTARGRLRRIERLRARAGPRRGGRRRLLDIGCGTGAFLAEARHAGWDVHGIEVSDYAAAEARGRGLPVTCAPIEEIRLEAAAFECVTLWDVLEHLRDPLAALHTAAGALGPHGVLALTTGDVTSLCARLSGAGWHLFNLPEHLFFFSPRCLREMLGRVDCRTARVAREVNWVPVAYLLERLRKSARLCAPHGRDARATRRRPRGRDARATGQWTGWQSWIVPATLFDVLGVYGVRNAELKVESKAPRQPAPGCEFSAVDSTRPALHS